MPEFSIIATSNSAQLELDRLRQRQASEATESVQADNTDVRSQQEGVEVSLSQQARALDLNASQQVATTGQTEATTTATESAAEPETANAASSQLLPEREAGNTSSLSRQFDQSANDALGTLINTRS